MGECCSHPPECSSGPAITLAHLYGCYVHEQVMSLSKNQYPLQCEPLDLIESNEEGVQHHAPAATRYLQPGWCRMVLHTPHICHKCITRHLFISNYPWSSYVPRPHTTHRAHKAHTDCTVIDRAQKLLVHTWHYMCTLTGHCSAGAKFRVMCDAVLALRTVARWGGAPRCPLAPVQ